MRRIEPGEHAQRNQLIVRTEEPLLQAREVARPLTFPWRHLWRARGVHRANTRIEERLDRRDLLALNEHVRAQVIAGLGIDADHGATFEQHPPIRIALAASQAFERAAVGGVGGSRGDWGKRRRR